MWDQIAAFPVSASLLELPQVSECNFLPQLNQSKITQLVSDYNPVLPDMQIEEFLRKVQCQCNISRLPVPVLATGKSKFVFDFDSLTPPVAPIKC